MRLSLVPKSVLRQKKYIIVNPLYFLTSYAYYKCDQVKNRTISENIKIKCTVCLI